MAINPEMPIFGQEDGLGEDILTGSDGEPEGTLW